MTSFIFKPISQGAIGSGRASFLIENTGFRSGALYDAQGNKIEDLQRFQGTPEPGQNPGVKFTASKPGGYYGQNLTAKFTDASGKEWSYSLPSGAQRYEGVDDDPSSLKPVNKGPMGPGGAFQPGQIGANGFYPGYLGGMYPQASLVNFNPITAAPYSPTDVMKFAKEFGNFNREEIGKNFNVAQDLALKELGTELGALKSFVPAASALKRSETALDNAFNQSQRTAQVNAALPGASEALAGQTERAQTLASGRLPSSIEDRAYEVGVRSAAADRSAAGGFGNQSSVSRKASDLLSAEQRLKLSQYGDQLLTSSIGARANLLLAPTEYSNAGSQVNVNPSLSSSQLTSSNLGQITGVSTVPATAALGSQVQQAQFGTELQQNTNTFNASQGLQAQEFNAQAQNQFAQNLFGYNVAYSGAVAGAAQTNANTNTELQQQQQFNDIMQQYFNQAQNAGTTSSIAQGVGASLPSLVGAISSLINLGGTTGVGPVANGADYAAMIQGGTGGWQSAGSILGAAAGTYFGGPGGAVLGAQAGAAAGPLVGQAFDAATKGVESVVSAASDAITSVVGKG